MKMVATLVLMCATAISVAQPEPKTPKTPKMKVEIWSDVLCPFCYIGKRKFETALSRIAEKNQIEIQWKSYQLQPDMKTDPTQNSVQHLAKTKGWSLDYARQAVAQVTEMAKSVGLTYHLDKAVVANSFDAHRLSHFAAAHGKGNILHELLFKAYFTEGKNIADHTVLLALAAEAGLPADAAKQALSDNQYAADVRSDMAEAQRMGVQGVPYFVFNRQYAISGAQPTEVFLQTLQKAVAGWKAEQPNTKLTEQQGAVCKPEGECK